MNWFDWLKIRPSGPKFENRPELSNPVKPDTKPTDEVITVNIDVDDFERNVFGRTHVRRGNLHMDFDVYLEAPASDLSKEAVKDKQRLQVALHEMMHVALWKRNDITHLANPSSLIYYKVTGSNLVPTSEDLELVRNATKLTPKITFKILFDKHKYPRINYAIVRAISTWNSYIGFTFFELIEV